MVVCELRRLVKLGVGVLILAPLHEVVGVFANEAGHEYVIITEHAFADGYEQGQFGECVLGVTITYERINVGQPHFPGVDVLLSQPGAKLIKGFFDTSGTGVTDFSHRLTVQNH